MTRSSSLSRPISGSIRPAGQRVEVDGVLLERPGFRLFAFGLDSRFPALPFAAAPC